MSDKSFHFIFFSTLFYLVILAPFTFLYFGNSFFVEPQYIAVDSARNESSTPRTFVLPANPAVAREQERKKEFEKNSTVISGCLVQLIDKGYNFSNIDDVTSHQVFVEILKFQYDNQLDPTGKINEEIRAILKC